MGFVGYYRRFIPRFADIAEPLVAMTGKDVPFVWPLFFSCEMRSSGPPFWLFLLILGTMCWIRTLAILVWVEYSAKSRMIKSGSLLTAAVLSGHLSANTAPQSEKCWQLSPCAYSFVPIYAALGSSSGRITSLLSGSTGLRIPKG